MERHRKGQRCYSARVQRKSDSLAGRRGFTLIELLVVMGIISVLASMLLPSLGQGKERARQATCLNNLRQMGISIKLYIDDHRFRFPSKWVRDVDPLDNKGATKSAQFTLGGRDPLPGHYADQYPAATVRPLYNYMRPSEVYKCPSDKGQSVLPGCGCHEAKPSNWATLGCSYHYNAGALAFPSGGGTLQPQADAAQGVSNKAEGWVTEPARYILMHEPPARLYGAANLVHWFQWHQAGGKSEFLDPQVAPRRFISPILFVDGHTEVHNFSAALATDPYHPYEPTQDWIWYKPADE